MKKVSLVCKDCQKEIFADVNMVMLRDELWRKVCDKISDAICDSCIEKRLGRKIQMNDLKMTGMLGLRMITCNSWWLENKKTRNESKRPQ